MLDSNCILWFFIAVALALSIAAIIVATNSEGFADIKFPKMGDAQSTGWYRTLGRECKPNDHKCVVKNNSGSYHYFCSKHKNCNIERENVQGELIDEPMAWQVRYA